MFTAVYHDLSSNITHCIEYEDLIVETSSFPTELWDAIFLLQGMNVPMAMDVIPLAILFEGEPLWEDDDRLPRRHRLELKLQP